MPIVIRKSDGKKITVPSGHFALNDDRFTVEDARPKPATKPVSKETRRGKK